MMKKPADALAGFLGGFIRCTRLAFAGLAKKFGNQVDEIRDGWAVLDKIDDVQCDVHVQQFFKPFDFGVNFGKSGFGFGIAGFDFADSCSVLTVSIAFHTRNTLVGGNVFGVGFQAHYATVHCRRRWVITGFDFVTVRGLIFL